MLLVATPSVLNEFGFKPLAGEMLRSSRVCGGSTLPSPPLLHGAVFTGGSAYAATAAADLAEDGEVTLRHVSDLFQPGEADENENRGVEGEGEVG